MAQITRRVETSKLYSTRSMGHWVIFLECGHEHTQKRSVPVPQRARCRSCETLRDGGSSCQDNGDGTMLQWGWDADEGWPTMKTVPTAFTRR